MPPDGLTETTLRNFFSQSLEMLCIAEDGCFVAVNPAWRQTMGWSDEELMSRPYLSFVHPDDVAHAEAHIRELTKADSRVSYQARFRRADGDWANLNWSCYSDGECVYGVASDISELIETVLTAERNEAVAVAVLDTAVDPVILIDTAGSIVQANDATARLFGYELEAITGQNINILMPEPYRAEHDGYLERYLGGGEARIIGIGREVEARRSDGSVFPISLAVSEIEAGGVHLFTGIIHDLTERNTQRDELRNANERLEQRVAARTEALEQSLAEVARSNRDLEQFAYIASHDLQAPLRNVRQGLELLDEHLDETFGVSFDDEARELRSLVVEAVLRMEELIKGLLAYSRLQRAEADEVEVDLDEVVAGVVDGLALDIAEVGAVVTVGELPTVTGDALQLHQLFQNLLQNAIRYRDDDRKLIVEIDSGRTESGQHLIRVADNGIGVESAHHERIFELFRRGHSGYNGLGLGLAICQRIAERHGGSIWIESSAGEGATFCVAL